MSEIFRVVAIINFGIEIKKERAKMRRRSRGVVIIEKSSMVSRKIQSFFIVFERLNNGILSFSPNAINEDISMN
jgi:hypothetical protein